LGVSAADVESLVSLAAKQAAKEEELAAARTQVGAAHSLNHKPFFIPFQQEEALLLCALREPTGKCVAVAEVLDGVQQQKFKRYSSR
jgi:hypothetical protein